MPAISGDMSNKTHVQSDIRDGEQEHDVNDVLQGNTEQQHAPERPSVANAFEKGVSVERAVTHTDPTSGRVSRTQRRSERRQQWRSEKRRRQRSEKIQLRKEEKRRRNNEQRLEGQRREFERKRDARRKAEEGAATARTQSQARENSDGDNHDQRRGDEASRVHDRQRTSSRTKAKMGGRQAATETSTAHLEHDPQFDKASRPTTTNEGCREFHLMSRPILASSFAPPSPIITPYFGHDDACGVYEDYQTSMEANYLFDPPLRSAPGVTSLPLVESVQTREDATDVLFEPSLERSVDPGAVIPRVKIYRAPTVYYSRNGGTYRNIREPHRGRGPGRGSRWRGRGGRGPRDEML